MKRYAITMKVDGRVSTGNTELRDDERFSRKAFIEQVKKFQNAEEVEILEVKRV